MRQLPILPFHASAGSGERTSAVRSRRLRIEQRRVQPGRDDPIDREILCIERATRNAGSIGREAERFEPASLAGLHGLDGFGELTQKIVFFRPQRAVPGKSAVVKIAAFERKANLVGAIREPDCVDGFGSAMVHFFDRLLRALCDRKELIHPTFERIARRMLPK